MKNSLKPNLDIRIKKPDTIQGPIRSFLKIVSVVIEIFSYRKKTLSTYV